MILAWAPLLPPALGRCFCLRSLAQWWLWLCHTSHSSGSSWPQTSGSRAPAADAWNIRALMDQRCEKVLYTRLIGRRSAINQTQDLFTFPSNLWIMSATFELQALVHRAKSSLTVWAPPTCPEWLISSCGWTVWAKCSRTPERRRSWPLNSPARQWDPEPAQCAHLSYWRPRGVTWRSSEQRVCSLTPNLAGLCRWANKANKDNHLTFGHKKSKGTRWLIF